MKFTTDSPEETIALGREIGQRLQAGDIIAFEGSLAAGKTTLTKGIAEALGIKETITSPTFTLISEYTGRLPLYHMDVYRLNSAEDFIEIGGEELLYGSGVCIIEWSEKIKETLPDSAITISIKSTGTDSRLIDISNWNINPFSADFITENV
ncbi:MAG: tRNA (adenosine(37)-N6)-threonylcarbamoyltransferase complex ATPase subunit type 1 TsaE [Bacteroides sp.]|nr:tRNA (adenosine(37)-N6)-threonylcarbamoyltransferase complex ATPase subunit type 1 TsaE [Prevotella sp.]MCM1408312.1 tRNA (adenosine(37)-N6)-threonylcarbamoyltransferase complex ATPase subunit type 1 TsaE [Treponema brennaborense]MCM1470456.1 tRNA (adenosine(37)-N6)-threonylcarbamoyltransferase complex ATPase subunit type 1 TsaE [Bacteroides sp.]